MIIGIAGRCRSGKTELAKVCESNGYRRLYFALPLKQLCANLLEISIDELNKMKDDKEPLGITIDDNFCEIISEETDITSDIVHKYCDGVVLKDVRHMLQFIGTDLIRNCNTNWHVNKIREMINPKMNYVFDDVRFPNEKKLIEELGGDCWFIIRPTIDNVSNHESETSLTWEDFGNNIIINDEGLNLFKFRWEAFLSKYEDSKKLRNKYLSSKYVLRLRDLLQKEQFNMFELLELSMWLFNREKREFDCSTIKNVTQGKEMAVDIEYKDGTHEYIANPLSIEDLKMCL